MKAYRVTAEFSDLLVKHARQSARAEASSLPHAVKKGLVEILRREGVKRKRIRIVTITVYVENGLTKQRG